MDEPILKRQRYSARYGARDPWLAGGVRAGVYLAWRALFAVWRPVIFAVLILGAAVCAWRAADAFRPALAQAAPSAVSDHAARLLTEPEAWWRGALGAALNPGPGRAPDLVLAESLAPVLPELAGRDRLARAILLESGRSPQRLEAELRAAPAWRRDQLLEAILLERLEAGAVRPGVPQTLIFASSDVADRLQRARALYGPALAQVEDWFADPSGRTLVLRGVPGLDSAPPRAALYGDVRDVIVQACALAESAGRRIGQCRVVFLPKPPGDLAQTGLALAAAETAGQARIGARVLKAAAAAGLADDRLIARLVLGPDEALAREAALAAAMTMISEAGERYTRPVFSEEDARRAGAEFTRAVRVDAAARDQVFVHFATVRREAGALAAVRLAGLVRSEEDAARLAALARRHGPALLGLHAAFGPELLYLAAGGEERRAAWAPGEAAMGDLAAAGLLLALALGLLGWVLASGWRRARGGAPGLVERVDAGVTRLILGRIS
ncbi:MAG: hypothetical protein ACFE0P_01315 [Oceanicaulis sp.]